MQSTGKGFETYTRYFLKEFSHLLEPNPRAIKRLVNAYGIYRSLGLLQDYQLLDSKEKRKQFVLWTIASLRWPAFMEWLQDNPNEVDVIVNGAKPTLDWKEFEPLQTQPDICKVFQGHGVGTGLTREAFCRAAGIVRDESEERPARMTPHAS